MPNTGSFVEAPGGGVTTGAGGGVVSSVYVKRCPPC